MKIAITLLALVALGYSAPQPRKLFHEHYEDFMELIVNESREALMALANQYREFEEFQNSLDYLETSGFKELVYEMEDLPEFKAVVEYLEGHDIDILFFVDEMNDFLASIQRRLLARQEVSGRDMTAFIKDSIAVFPKEKLTALFNEKIAEDEVFKLAMESFKLDEWNQLYDALWANEVFLAEVQSLRDNGVDVQVLLDEVKAVMGIYE